MFDNRKTMCSCSSALLMAFISAVVPGGVARADFVFGTPVNLGEPLNLSFTDEVGPCLSPDGLELYFQSYRPGGYGRFDIWVAKRATVQDPWGPPANLGPQINTSGGDGPGSLSPDGLIFYFDSQGDLYTTTRATKDSPWGPPVSLGPIVNSSYEEIAGIISADGLELFFSSTRPGGYGDMDIWLTKRASSSDPWGTPVNLGLTFNSPGIDILSWISPEGRIVLVWSDRPGGFGRLDMWMAARSSKNSPWGPLRNLGSSINTVYSEFITAISPDGRFCYFNDFLGSRPGGLGGCDMWQAPIRPIVDFSNDGVIDLIDLVMLIDNWGTDRTLFDIGPMPWGDGRVDIEDLKAFTAEWEKENPPVQP